MVQHINSANGWRLRGVVHGTTVRPPWRFPDYPDRNVSVKFSCGHTDVAPVYFTADGNPRGIAPVTLGEREENLARIQDSYAALGWKLVGT